MYKLEPLLGWDSMICLYLKVPKNFILWDFEIQTDHRILTRRRGIGLINRKKRTCSQVDFAVLVNYKMKPEESEKLAKYFDIVREMKKLKNIRVTVVPIVIRSFGTVPKDLEKRPRELEIRGSIKATQTTPLLKSARFFEES